MPNYSEIDAKQSLWKNREAVLHHQIRTLRDLIRHAWGKSSFYRDLYRSHGIKEKDIGDLKVDDLPFISKQILMDNFDDMVTDSRLRKKELEEWILSRRDPSKTFAKDFIVINSSGSSGNIGLFVFDQKAYNVMASTMAMRLPPPKEGIRTKIAFYRATHGHFGGITAAMRMPNSVYDVLALSLLDTSEKTITQLNSFQPQRLNGYSSSVTTLAEWALQGQLRINPQIIIVSGDLLTAKMERIIREAWGAPIYIIYGASESPCLAVKESRQEEMTVMDDLNILEVLGDDDLQVSVGEEGRVVITNLYNYALPLLRYELGDNVARGNSQNGLPFTTIRNLTGRVNDVLPVVLQNGLEDKINWHILTSFYVPGCTKIQFISKRPDYVQIQYTGNRNIDGEIRNEFQQLLNMKKATQTTFDVQRVRDIPNDPRTGKLRMVRLEGTQRSEPFIPVSNPSPALSPERTVGPANAFNPFDKEEIEQSIPDRFERQVRKNGNRLAVKSQDNQFTYDELNKAANRVARAVLNHSGEEPVPVALLFEQNTSLIAALMGVLKSGNFYVPLDPSFPSSRTTFMLKDSGAKLILTDSKNLPFASELSKGSTQVMNCDEIDPDISDKNIGLSISPDQYAWLLYTSGSTGQPKGVVQNHRNVLHFVMNYTNGIHICPDDRLSLLRHISVFGAVRDILGALLNGATILPFDVRNEGIAHLADWLIREGITISFFGSPLFRYFLDNFTGKEEFPTLRLIRLGSDSVRKKDVENFKKYFPPHCLLVNGLSSTETGTVRRYFIDKETEILTSTVPVGYPVEDAEVLLLDEHGDEVDAGQVGEIAVRSRYLALGYWKRPDLTEAAFMEDPEDGTRRIYRMGDLGRMSPDGRLEHLGRKDFQVKIRGYRVEISEVEMALLDLDTIQDTVVLVREDRPGDQRLVAYVVPAVQPSPDISMLRKALAKSLPEYMTPSAFVVLDSIPLNPNGKVDRKALPAPPTARPHLETSPVGPRTPTEETLIEIWTEVLNLEHIGIHDHFMELGGHSLQAGQIIARVLNKFGVSVPIRAFFDEPTIANLAELISCAPYES